MQIPSTGTLDLRRIESIPILFIKFIEPEASPTPGRIILSAERTDLSSDVMIYFSPIFSSADLNEKRFPAP
jgi:hypothetical protein